MSFSLNSSARPDSICLIIEQPVSHASYSLVSHTHGHLDSMLNQRYRLVGSRDERPRSLWRLLEKQPLGASSPRP